MECVVISAHVVAKMEAISWTVEEKAQLIDLYETYPCLYNTRDKKNYHDRDSNKRPTLNKVLPIMNGVEKVSL